MQHEASWVGVTADDGAADQAVQRSLDAAESRTSALGVFFAASQYGDMRRRDSTMGGKASIALSISVSVVYRLRLKRTEP